MRVLTVRGDTGDTRPYEEALRGAGVEPVFGTALDDVLSGLMLMGGNDVNPSLYGEPRHSETQPADDPRDALECSLIAQALDQNLPILAICRGLQILNVQHGGSLIQHLEPVEKHKQKLTHKVEIMPGTRLACIGGSHLEWEVNSRHHQAIGRLGDGLIVSARDPEDGVIEAVERPDKRFVVAVQWHPENQICDKGAYASKLFAAFAASL
jgi:putative glutamine amidotransferase